MGITKTDQYTKSQLELYPLIKALGHPARLAIIDYLKKVNTCICGDIVGELPLSQATVSQHLKELKAVGLIKGSIEGNSICYCIDPNAVQNLNRYFSQLSDHLTNQNKCC